MDVKKMGSKLTQGVRQVKAQQDKSGAAEVAKPQTLPAAVRAVNKPGPVVKPAVPKPAQKIVQSGGEQAPKSGAKRHPLRVWPD